MGNILGDVFDTYVKEQIEVRQNQRGQTSYSTGTLGQGGPLNVFHSNTPFLRLSSSVNVNSFLRSSANVPASTPDKIGELLNKKPSENTTSVLKGSVLEKLINSGISRDLIEGDKLARACILQGGSAVSEDNSVILNKGLNETGAIFNGAYGWGGLEERNERGFVPMPGLLSADVKYYNNGALSKSTIKIKCFSKLQFQIIDVLYLRPGYTLLLEFGNTMYFDNDGVVKGRTQLNSNSILNKFLDGSVEQFELYELIEKKRKGLYGNYNAVYGKITKFGWSYGKDGTYECTVDITGLGSIIESLKINTGPTLTIPNEFPVLKAVIEAQKKSIENLKNNPYNYAQETITKFEEGHSKYLKSYLHLKLRDISLTTTAQARIDNKDQYKAEYDAQALAAVQVKREAYDNRNGEGEFDRTVGVRTSSVAEKKAPGGIYYDDLLAEYIEKRKKDFAESSSTGANIKVSTKDVILHDIDQQYDGKRENVAFRNSVVVVEGLSGTEDEEVKSPQAYIKFGMIVKIIQYKLLIYDKKNNNTPFFKFDMSNIFETDRNYILKIPGQFSTNPSVCLVPYSNTQYDTLPEIPGLEINNQLRAIASIAWDADVYVGRLANVLINIDHVLTVLDNSTNAEDNSIAILPFLQSLIQDITKSLGGINNIEVQTTDDGLVKFVDKIPPAFSKLFPNPNIDEVTTIQVSGVERGTRASIATDFSLSSELSPAFGAALAIGAQANGNQVSGNATSFSQYSLGLEDRIIKEKTSIITGGDTSPSKNAQDLFDECKEFFIRCYGAGKFDSATITGLESTGNNFIQFLLGALVNVNQIPSPFFLPFNLSLTLDGISGIKLYQRFKINDEVLPPSYRKGSVDLLVKAVNHSIGKDGWKTKIDTLSTPSPPGSGTVVPTPPRAYKRQTALQTALNRAAEEFAQSQVAQLANTSVGRNLGTGLQNVINGVSPDEAQQIRDNIGSNIVISADEWTDRTKTVGPAKYPCKKIYANIKSQKFGICLHYSVTYNNKKTVDAFNSHNNGISSHFGTDQDGAIEQFVPIELMTYTQGLKAYHVAEMREKGYDGNTPMPGFSNNSNQNLISIECVSIGYMNNGSYRASDDTYVDNADNRMPAKFPDGSPRVAQCVNYDESIIPKWKGKTHWECLSKEQIASLKSLLTELSKIFAIPIIVSGGNWARLFPDVTSYGPKAPQLQKLRELTLDNPAQFDPFAYRGLFTHCNYHLGKSDMWPQLELLRMLKEIEAERPWESQETETVRNTGAGGEFRNLLDVGSQVFNQIFGSDSGADEQGTLGDPLYTGPVNNNIFTPHIQSIIDQLCEKAKVSRDVFYTAAFIESSGNPNAKASNAAQAARGLFQIIPKYAGDYGVGGKDLFDPAVSTIGAINGFKKNYKAYKEKFNRPPQTWELYLMWNQGFTGSTNIIDSAENGTTLSSTIKSNMRNNSVPATDDPVTFLSQWKAKWISKRKEALGL